MQGKRADIAALDPPYEFEFGVGRMERSDIRVTDSKAQFIMPYYRRRFVPGGTYFFTVNIADRKDDLLVREVEKLRSAWRYVMRRHPFETHAVVILPDHVHCIWQLPPDDQDFPMRWRLLKTEFSRALPRSDDASIRRRGAERAIWQRRYWEHAIRDEEDFNRHVDYIHFNPVKHHLVANPDDWPYSSWHEWKKEFGRPISIPPVDWLPPHLGERA